MKCRNCNSEIPEKSLKCPNCGEENVIIDINNEKVAKIAIKAVNTVKIIKLIPVVILAIVFSVLLAVSSYSYLKEHSSTRGYVKISGKLLNVDCENNHNNNDDNEKKYDCTGNYKYTVNGKDYSVSPAKLSDESGFKENVTVWYNPNKPEEAIIYADWGSLLFSSILMLTFLLIVFIRIVRIPSKIK